MQKQPGEHQTTGYWDCDCGRECRYKEGPERPPACRAEWVPTTPPDNQTTGHALTDFVRRVFELQPPGQIILSMTAVGENVVITTDRCIYLMKPHPTVDFTVSLIEKIR